MHRRFLSLHSTMFLLILAYLFHKPYISPIFTFHYVSINTTEHLRKTGWLLVSGSFTFHYVSINTARWKTNSQDCFTLHSTMFLLIPEVGKRGAVHIHTLHSTMFLLILWFSDESCDAGSCLYIPLCFY